MRRDEQDFQRYKEVIEKENLPKTLADFQEMKYNKTEEFKLLKHYRFARNYGKISALVSFKQFQATKTRIENATIGQVAANGIKVSSVSLHFVDRFIGTIYEKNKHEGMHLKDMKKILFKGVPKKVKEDKKGRVSQTIEIDGLGVVTINPETGELVQCNKS